MAQEVPIVELEELAGEIAALHRYQDGSLALGALDGPTLELLVKIADALRLEPLWLFDLPEEDWQAHFDARIEEHGLGCGLSVLPVSEDRWAVVKTMVCLRPPSEEDWALDEPLVAPHRRTHRRGSAGAKIGVGILAGVGGLTLAGLGIHHLSVASSSSSGVEELVFMGLGLLEIGSGIPLMILGVVSIAAGVEDEKWKKKRGVAPTAWFAPDGGVLGLTGQW
jgi:hypothetical protein